MDEEGVSVDKLAEVLRKASGDREREKTPTDRLMEADVIDELQARRRRRERMEKQELENEGGGGSMGFRPREMMDMMMMQTFMQRMGGGGGSDLSEIMKWKAIAGNGKDGDLDKVIQVLREEANAQRERQDQMMAQMYGEKKAEEFRRFQEGMLAKQEERDQLWEEKLREKDAQNRKLEEALASQGKKPEGSRYVDSIPLSDAGKLKKEMEEVGVLKPASAEEREQRKLELDRAGAEAAAQRSAETNKDIMHLLDRRVEGIEASLDRKLDKIMGMFMNEQAARMKAAGVEPPVQQVSEADQRRAYEDLQRRYRSEQQQQGDQSGQGQDTAAGS